jgi:Ca2+-binding RTX toxin-like protein
MRRIPILAITIGAALAAVPATASASVAGFSSNDGETMLYAADPGERNNLTVSTAGGRIVFDDPGATIAPERGCTRVTPKRVSGEPPRGGYTSVLLADGDDEATSSGNVDQDVAGIIGLSGEQGDDTLRGTDDAGQLNGGAGENRLIAGAGTQSIDAVLTSGDGSPLEMPAITPVRDEITCVPPAPGSLPRSVAIDESDEVTGDCGIPPAVFTRDAVVVRGTDGPENLSGYYYPTSIYGLGGDDRLFGTGTQKNRMDGGPGNDTIESGGLLLGGEGNDRLTSAIANDIPVRQDGGPGDDLLIGRYGPDRLVGGPGRDRLSGGSGNGNDYVNARDGERDSVRCGDGRADRVAADKIDSVARDCERVSRR